MNNDNVKCHNCGKWEPTWLAKPRKDWLGLNNGTHLCLSCHKGIAEPKQVKCRDCIRQIPTALAEPDRNWLGFKNGRWRCKPCHLKHIDPKGDDPF